jgi:hypothetical protein
VEVESQDLVLSDRRRTTIGVYLLAGSADASTLSSCSLPWVVSQFERPRISSWPPALRPPCADLLPQCHSCSMTVYSIDRSRNGAGFEVSIISDNGARQTMLGFATVTAADAWIAEDKRLGAAADEGDPSVLYLRPA